MIHVSLVVVGKFYIEGAQAWRTAQLIMAVAAVTGLGACSSSGEGDNGGTEGTESAGELIDYGACDACELNGPGEGAITEYFARFAMPVERSGCTTLHRPHSENRWNVFYPGRCAGCSMPNHMGAASFDNTLIVSWVASAAYEDTESPNERKFGHLSTFTFTEEAGFTKVSDFVFDECDHDMGEVAVSADGSVIGALCLSNRSDHDGKKDLILLEWTGGEITQDPTRREVVSGSAGGWAGQWDISLNHDLTHYYIAATTVLDGGHRGMTRFAWNRQAAEKTASGSCGGGHPTTNRITHNSSEDAWSLFCRMDTKSINWVLNGTSDLDGVTEKLGEWSTTSLSDTPGGLHNGISLGQNGWLVAATGPFDLFDDVPNNDRKDALRDQQIGLRHLPASMSEFQENPDDAPWQWIETGSVCAPTNGSKRLAGMVQLNNFGMGGEDSGRVLLGYSPTRGHTSSDEFHAVEIDTEGNFLHAPVVLQRGGWGVDNTGTHMPGSGCVVFPYTWTPDEPEEGVQSGYPKFEQSVSDRSAFLKLTALCPTGPAPTSTAPSCSLQQSDLIQAADADDIAAQDQCPSY